MMGAVEAVGAVKGEKRRELERKLRFFRHPGMAGRWFFSLSWLVVAGGVCVFIFFMSRDPYLTGWVGFVLVSWTGIFLWRSPWFNKRVHAFFGRVPRLRDVNHGGYFNDYSTFHRETATTAFDLIPQLDKFLSSSCDLVLTGNDCFAMTKEDYPWRIFLEICLEEKGCNVIQYMSHGEHEADSIVQEMQKAHPDSFECRKLMDPALVTDPRERALIEGLKTFHPTLAWNRETDDKVMWVERYHPPGSRNAFGCDYYDEEALARNSEGFEFYRNTLEEAWDITRRHAAGSGDC